MAGVPLFKDIKTTDFYAEIIPSVTLIQRQQDRFLSSRGNPFDDRLLSVSIITNGHSIGTRRYCVLNPKHGMTCRLMGLTIQLIFEFEQQSGIFIITGKRPVKTIGAV